MNIFNLTDDDEVVDKLNLDDLFEKKREIAENKLQLYNKILNRIHERIKLTSRQNQGKEQFCWYLIPEMMIGVSRYDVEECTNYILRKLRENNFQIRYTHPNLLFISWKHWLPGYVRQEYKKQTGQAIDGLGNLVNPETIKEEDNTKNLLLNTPKTVKEKEKNNPFNSTKNYKPSGIYNNELMEKINDKFKI
tara:strand:+ start:3158 stop:3733 length:576 start_codon:yes stop_codon:yes gene_type:complete